MGHENEKETVPLLDGNVEKSSSTLNKYGKGALLLSSVAGVLFAGAQYTSNTQTSLSTSSQTGLKLALSNEYTAVHGHPAKDYTWVEEGMLVEPHKTTKVALDGVTDKRVSTCKALHSHSDEVIEGVTSEEGCDLVFTKPGSFKIQVWLQNDEEKEEPTLSTDVTSRYVRRDIRKLNSDDLSTFMDAMHTLYQMDPAYGIATYGPEFKSISYFVEKHLTNSVPDKQHDYMHDGMGFLTQHISITNEFEESLQLINPALSMPYWDFTQDHVRVAQKATQEGRDIDYSDLWSLDIWTEDYFGSAVGSPIHTVTEGRWAYTTVPKAESKNSLHANGYGFLRAPWNLQSTAYVTRYHKMCGEAIGGTASYLEDTWPTCSTHYAGVFDIDAYAEFVPYMAYVAHAGVHLMIGGSGGAGESSCDDWTTEMKSAGSSMKMIKSQSAFLLRNLWRYDLCTAPSSEDCEDSVINGDTSACKLTCAGCESDKFTEDQLTDLLQWFGGDVAALSSKDRQSIARTIFCDTKIVLGEHVEAASPADASFWPMHPTLERLMQYKQLVQPFTDVTWDASGYRSDWTSECKWGLTFGTDCAGHGASDVTAGKVSTLDEDTGLYSSKALTNFDLMEVTKSHKTFLLPYVYDTFDYSHCEAVGVSFKKIPKTSD